MGEVYLTAGQNLNRKVALRVLPPEFERDSDCLARIRREATLAAVLDQLKAEIDAYRQGGRHAGMFPERWLPAAFAVLGEAFTEQNRMLNSTLKVVRGRVVEAYRDRINFLYTPEGKDPHNPQNRSVISRLFKRHHRDSENLHTAG